MLLRSEKLPEHLTVEVIPFEVNTFRLRSTTEFSYWAVEVKSHLPLAT